MSTLLGSVPPPALLSCHLLTCWPDVVGSAGELVWNAGGPHGSLSFEPPLILHEEYSESAAFLRGCGASAERLMTLARHDVLGPPTLVTIEPGLGAFVLYLFPLTPLPSTVTIVPVGEAALSLTMLPGQGPVGVAFHSDLSEVVAQLEIHCDQPYALGAFYSAPLPEVPCEQRQSTVDWVTDLGVRATARTAPHVNQLELSPLNTLVVSRLSSWSILEPEPVHPVTYSLTPEREVQAVRLNWQQMSLPFWMESMDSLRFSGLSGASDDGGAPAIQCELATDPLLGVRIRASVATGATLRAVLYHAGALVGQAYGLGPDIAVAAAPPYQVQPGSFDQVPDITLWWFDPVELVLSDGQMLIGDELRMISEDPGLLVSGYTELEVEFLSTGPFECIDLGITPVRTPGDLNCDDQVDFNDIDPFVMALVSRALYSELHPNCNYDNADCNGDGLVDFNDIDAFVLRLIGS